MKKLAQIAMAAWLSMLLCGCVGFSWTSEVDDGAVYELNREMYVAEEDEHLGGPGQDRIHRRAR